MSQDKNETANTDDSDVDLVFKVCLPEHLKNNKHVKAYLGQYFQEQFETLVRRGFPKKKKLIEIAKREKFLSKSEGRDKKYGRMFYSLSAEENRLYGALAHAVKKKGCGVTLSINPDTSGSVSVTFYGTIIRTFGFKSAFEQGLLRALTKANKIFHL